MGAAGATSVAAGPVAAPASAEAAPFPKGLVWGAATSAYQVEGAAREDGRGESVWDRFCAQRGRIADGSSGAVAADHYHRWQHDLDLMQRLGLHSYRFSVAWPRIRPEAGGPPDRRGLDFYKRLADGLRARGIAPMATLFNWDTPQWVQDLGGWENRDTARRFADYAHTVAQALGDRVDTYCTVNEPKTVVQCGYLYGNHAPGIADGARGVPTTRGPVGGRVADADRISFLRDHLAAARRAIGNGVPLKGYYLWSLLDNFEWHQGYTQRWGMVHVDYTTQVRTPKDSASWCAGVIARNGGSGRMVP